MKRCDGGVDQLMQNDDARVGWLHAQKITIRDNDKWGCGVSVGTKEVCCRYRVRDNESLEVVFQY